jgi:serine/threonine protein kinase
MRALQWLGRRAKAQPVDRIVEVYRAEAEPGTTSLNRFWNRLNSRTSPSILAALVKIDLGRRFERGERPRVLEYLERFPILAEDRDRVVSLVYEEFCLLEEKGANPDSELFCEDYEPWGDSLRSQLVYHRELSRAIGVESPPVKFPEPGDQFDKYRLNSILGEGGVARVFLATEEGLGDRQLAIKVSHSFGQEPSILAKLDHRNIVPILTVAESESGLRGICMPYRPGLTLEDLIRRIGQGTPPRDARAIAGALRPKGHSTALAPEGQRVGWDDFPTKGTFAEAVAWIGLALANALSYLHEQGVFHRDIKPANILLAYREGPQLLDFNLAQVPNNPADASAAQKGGTLPYMAPEQLKAFLDPSAWGDVAEAADLYSLGLVLRELLTGRAPERPTSQGALTREIQSLLDRRLIEPVPIGEINPAVTPALASIIDKCLAFRPEDRYADADELAVDLRRFLDRKPLRVAPNTSRLELAVNWVVRNRKALVGTIGFVVALFLLVRLLLPGPPGEAEFARAEAHLDSERLEDWQAARVEFQTLHEQRPDTARSSLGLALTLRKLRDPNTSAISELIQEAVNKPDAEKVLREALDHRRDSDVLHLNLGIVYEINHHPDLARAELERALEIDPNGMMAHTVLARIEENAGRDRVAIGHLERSIGLGKERDVKAGKIYGLRQNLIRILVHSLDQSVEVAGGHIDPTEAASDARRLEDHLRSFQDDWPKIETPGGQARHEFFLNYYQGCSASIQGVLEAIGEDRASADELFRQADDHFREARRLVSGAITPRDQRSLFAQEQKLIERRRPGDAPH